MRRAYLVLPLAGLVILGCQDQQLPTQPPQAPAPNFQLTPQQALPDARALIDKLFPTGPLRLSAHAQLSAIVADMTAAPPRIERAKLRALGLIVFTAALYQHRKLLDPNGSASPTTLDGALQLICDISIIVPLPKIQAAICPLQPGAIAGGDAFVVVVNSSADRIDDFVVSPSKNLVVKIPWGQGDVVVIGTRLLDGVPVQNVYSEASKPKWRVVLLPTRDPLPAGTPDSRRFQLTSCVDEGLESDVRTQYWKPYLRLLQVHADRSVTVPDPAPPLGQSTGCVLAEHPPIIGALPGPLSRLASRGAHALRRLAAAVAALLSPEPLFARGNTAMIDVGGVGGLLDGFSDFPLGYVFPDLFIGNGEGGMPALGSSSVVQGGTVSVSLWTVTNAVEQGSNPRPSRPAGGAPGDVALVDHVLDHDVTLPAVRHSYYLSADNKFDPPGDDISPDDILLDSTSTPRDALIAGASVNVPGTTLTVPATWPAGPAYVLVVVDDQNRVPEIRPTTGNDGYNGETNNILALPITVTTACPEGHVVDGMLCPGEWGESVASLLVNLPGGGTTPGELFISNDATNLYFAVRFQRSVVDPGNSAAFEFDSNDNSSLDEGDDGIILNPSVGFSDLVRSSAPPCPAAAGLCSLLDTQRGGTNDGAAAFRNDGTFTVYEFSHPLSSGDALDFSRSSSQTLGLFLSIRLLVSGASFADTRFPEEGFHTITIGP